MLTGSGHDGAAYDITGPEALTMAETAAEAVGGSGAHASPTRRRPRTRRATRRDTSRMEEMEEARLAKTGQGLTDLEVDIWISHYCR